MHAEPISTVLERVGAELEAIARRIDRNQATIASTTWNIGAGDAGYVQAMQDADLSAQRISGVAGFLRMIGEAAPADWHVDTASASDTLKLAELVRTIGAAGAAMQPAKATDAGETDFF
jgi:hypothetical protein